MAAAVYAAQSDLEGRLGVAAVALRLASNPDAATNAIKRASRKLDYYLRPRYGDQLQASAWVTEACADIATVYFTQNLANPAPESVLMSYDELEGTGGKPGVLEKIRKGLANVPDIAALVSGAPRLTNVHISERPVPHPVAEPARSTTGQTITPRRDDRWDPLRWSWEW